MKCLHCKSVFDWYASGQFRPAASSYRCPACGSKLARTQPVRPPKTYCIDCGRPCRRGKLRCVGCDERQQARQARLAKRNKEAPAKGTRKVSGDSHEKTRIRENLPKGSVRFRNEYAEGLRKTGRKWELGD